jgi:hypothetical protein
MNSFIHLFNIKVFIKIETMTIIWEMLPILILKSIYGLTINNLYGIGWNWGKR